MATSETRASQRAAHPSEADSAEERWAAAAAQVRDEVVRHPYLTLLAATSLGGLLAGRVGLRMLLPVADLGVRVAVALALPALTAFAQGLAPPER